MSTSTPSNNPRGTVLRKAHREVPAPPRLPQSIISPGNKLIFKSCWANINAIFFFLTFFPPFFFFFSEGEGLQKVESNQVLDLG